LEERDREPELKGDELGEIERKSTSNGKRREWQRV